MGNEMKEWFYLEEKEKRKCRVCGRGEETSEHVWGKCACKENGERMRWEEMVERILEEKGERREMDEGDKKVETERETTKRRE